VTLSIGIGFVDAAIKVFVYYSHERMWDRMEFGRRKKVEEDYMI
jgi:uncharacterized membrane protein